MLKVEAGCHTKSKYLVKLLQPDPLVGLLVLKEEPDGRRFVGHPARQALALLASTALFSTKVSIVASQS